MGVATTPARPGRRGCWPWAADPATAKTLRVDFLPWRSARPPQGRVLARQAARRGKRVAGLAPAASGGYKDARAAWMAGALTIGD